MGFKLNTKNISLCKKCGLCNNQQPLLQKKIVKSSIFWVGLSAVKNTDLFDNEPLSPRTSTGKLISEIEEMLPEFSFYKTNAVKCLPLNNDGKIRYPTTKEMNLCFQNMQMEINKINPSIIILLGAQVSQFFLKQYNIPPISFNDEFSYSSVNSSTIKLLPIHHPSYIQVYKRKKSTEYKQSVSTAIRDMHLYSAL